MDQKLLNFQKKIYMRISVSLWQNGPEEAHDEYPQISVRQFETANKYFDSLRCEGCSCGSCINLPELASNLDKSPPALQPLATLAQKLGKEQFEQS